MMPRLLLCLALGIACLTHAKTKVVVLGVDGLDPVLLERFVDEGALPNFARLMANGDYAHLQTTMPPQSPTAWATFITGLDPGGHGIYDFIHRDPETMELHASLARVIPGRRAFAMGSWVMPNPFSPGKVESRRDGDAFWQILDGHGVRSAVFRIPANFPPAPSTSKTLSGMGTPDLLGTSGTFTLFAEHLPQHADEITGGTAVQVHVVDHRVDARLIGPENEFRRVVEADGTERHPPSYVDFQVFLDPEAPTAKLAVQGHEFILRQGAWSDWVRVEFTLVPWAVQVSAVARFYLQEARPNFRLYVTPLQINPAQPALPITTPRDWGYELSQRLGYFYTQEFPEDTKALSSGVFTGREFVRQAGLVYQESSEALDYFLETFEEGLLFFYFTSVDQQSHVLWRYVDPSHPGYDPSQGLADGIRNIYRNVDDALGRVVEAVGEDTSLIVMSDHGFAPFYWSVHLNSWLVEKGYLMLKHPSRQGDPIFGPFEDVDWSRTRAYAVGLNGLYVNLQGREINGAVVPGESYERLLAQLEEDLLAFRDPRNGRQVVSLVVRPGVSYHGPHKDQGPDLIVGYARGYRSSWDSPLGRIPREIIEDNHDAWSGDHCIDYRQVPGVLLTNEQITMDAPALHDLTVGILAAFGVQPPAEMIGQNPLAFRRDEARP